MVQALRREDTNAFAAAARNDKDYHSLLETGLAYAQQGVTSIAEVIRIVGEAEEEAGLPEIPEEMTEE
jgi:MSHA biogenesis protein MshE